NFARPQAADVHTAPELPPSPYDLSHDGPKHAPHTTRRHLAYLRHGQRESPRPARCKRRYPPRRIYLDHGLFRFRKVHVDEYHRPTGSTEKGNIPTRRRRRLPAQPCSAGTCPQSDPWLYILNLPPTLEDYGARQCRLFALLRGGS